MTKTHTMRSRLISLVLVLVMVLGCLPLSALAADPPTSSFTKTWTSGDFRVQAELSDGYTLQTVSGSNPKQNTKLDLTIVATQDIANEYNYIYIALLDSEGKEVRRVMWNNVKVEETSSGSGDYCFTNVGSVFSHVNDVNDPPALQPKVSASADNKYAYIDGIAYTVEGAGTFPVYAQIGYQVKNSTAVTLPAQRIGTFNIASYSDDVMTKNLTFNLDATDAYYAYSTVAMVANENYKLPTVTPIREHYTFKGWKLDDTTTYQPGDTISYTETNKDLMLTAVWKLEQVRVDYPADTDLPNGVTYGTTAPTNGAVDYGTVQSFNLVLDEGYDPATLFVTANDVLLAPVNYVADTDGKVTYTYSFTATADTTVEVSDDLAKLSYVVTMPVGHFTAKLTGTGITSEASTTVEYGGSYSFTVTPEEGYEITGVYVNGAELTAVNGVYTVEDVKTAQKVEVLVEAIPNYTVTYVVNDKQYTTQVVAKGEKVAALPENPVVTGYTFDGWYTEQNGSGTQFEADTAVSTNITVYAKLTAKTYTISYNGNGMTPDPTITATNKTYGKTATLDATALNREGYTFLGWSRNQKATEATYAPGDVFTEEITDNITLYAVWKANTYTVTLPTGTGYTVVTTKENVVAWNGSFSFDVVVDRGYVETAPVVEVTDGANKTTLTATNTNPAANTDGSKTYSYTISAIKENKVVSITVGKNQTYTVTFTLKKETDVYQTQEVEYGYCATAPVAPEVMGYTFNGWLLNDAKYNFSTPVTKNITLSADLQPIYNTVTLPVDGTGYTVTPARQNNVFYNSNFSFQVTVEDGYSDANMFVVANGAPLYYNSKTYDETAKTTTYNYKLYNVKTPYEVFVNGVERKTVTITYIDNGGFGGPGQQVANYYVDGAGDNTDVSNITPTRDGYVFLGWAETNTATAGDVVYKYGDTAKKILKETTDTTLYAVWAKATATIEIAADVTEQYEGKDVVLTATVTADGEAMTSGSVEFFRVTEGDQGEVTTSLGTVPVNGGKATMTVQASAWSEKYNEENYSAKFIPAEGFGYAEAVTTRNAIVHIKSTAIAWELAEDAENPGTNVAQNTLTVSKGTMTAGSTFTLTIPDVVTKDGKGTAAYTVQWQEKKAGQDWQNVGTDGKSYTVTEYVSGTVYRAILTPADPYTKAQAYNSDGTEVDSKYVYTLVTAETGEVDLQETATTLEVTDTNDLNGTTAEFEGQDITLTASVTYGKNVAVTEGYVQFYLNGNEIGEPVPVNASTGRASLPWETSAFEEKQDVYTAKYLGTERYAASSVAADGAKTVAIRSTAIAWQSNSAVTVTKNGQAYTGTLNAGETYTITIAQVNERATTTKLTVGKDYTVQWYSVTNGVVTKLDNVGNGDSITVTPTTSGMTYYAEVYPMTGSNYTKAFQGNIYGEYLTSAKKDSAATATTTTLTLGEVNAVATGNPANEQYEGKTITLTADVKAGDVLVNQGNVTFYAVVNDAAAVAIATVPVVNGQAQTSYKLSDYGIDEDNVTAFYAEYKDVTTEGGAQATYADSHSYTTDPTDASMVIEAADKVTVRSTTISWELNDKHKVVDNALTIYKGDSTADEDKLGANAKMEASKTYTLKLPSVYALDDFVTPLKVNEDYEITWQYYEVNKNSWTDYTAGAREGNTVLVTPEYSGYAFRAVISVNDADNSLTNFKNAAAYTDGTYSGKNLYLYTAETGTVAVRTTKTTLEVSDTHDIKGDDSHTVAEFEGQNVTLTATVVDDAKAPVTTGYVQFYRDKVEEGNKIGEPVAVNGDNGTATIEATMSSYEKDGKVDSYIAKYLTNETYKESVSEAKAVQIRSTAIAWGKLDHDTEDMALTITDLNTNTVLGEDDILVAGHTYQLDLPEVYERDRESIGALTVNEDYRVDWYQFNADATQGELIASLVNLDTVMVKPETDGVGYYAIVTPVDGSNYTKAWTIVKGNWAYNNFLITGTEERSGATPTEIALTIDGAVAMGNSWEQYEGRTITLNAEVNVADSETTMVEHGNVSFYVITKQGGQDQVTVTSELIGGQPVAVENGMASVAYELPEYLLDEDLDNIEYFYAVYADVSTELSEEVRYAPSTTATVSGLDEDITTEKIPDQNQLQVRSIAITWQLNADKSAIADGANAITIYNYDAATDGKGAALGEDEVMDADKSYVLEMPAVYAYDAVTGTTKPLAIGTDYTVQWQYYVEATESWMDYKGKDAYSASIVVTPEYHDYGFRVQVTPKYDNDSLTGFRKAAKYDGNAVAALDFQVLYSDTTVPTDRKATATDLAITGADWELQNVMVDGDNNTFTADHYAQFEGQTVTLKATVTEADAPNVMIPTGYVYFYRYEVNGQTVLLNATPVEVKDGIAELEVTITNYNVAKLVTENADKFFAVYEPNDTYDGSTSTTTNAEGAYLEPAETDWVYIKSTSIKTPIVESALPGKIEGQDDPAYATTYEKDLTELQAGVEHTFTLRQKRNMAEQDYSVVALDGRYVEDSNYTIQWLVKNGDNEETTAAENVNPYVTTTTKTGDKYRLWLEPKGDMTVGAYSEHLIVGTKQLVNVTVVASDEIEATEETDVYQLNDITLTATVEGAEPENTMKPTGTVTFYYRTKDTTSAWTEIGEAALAEDSVTGKMVATLVTDELPVDAETYTKRDLQIYAIYNGDETFEVSATAKKVEDEELFNIAGTEGSATVDDTVTVYSSVVKRSTEENKAYTPTTAPDGKDGLMAYVDGNLMVNEENVTLMLSDLYTLDGAEVDAVISKLTHGTDYTIIWQELTNYESYKNADLNDAPWTNLNDSDTHQYNVNVKQGAAYRAMITVKDTAPVQGSFTEVLQADADDATSGSKIYYTNILVPTLGQSTLSYNITSSVQNQENSEGIVEGETATVHVYINGATETTPISSLTVSITKQGETEPVYTDTRYSVNGYTAIDWQTEEGDAGYYTLTIEAVPSNGYEPETLTRTIIVRDNTYTLNVSNLNPTYNGKTQGVSVTVEGMDIEADLAAKSWTVTYDEEGNKVEPSQAGTYTFVVTLPASAYWTEKTVEGTFTIEKRQVSVADLVAQAKVYDGTTGVNLLEIVLDDAETAQSTTGLPTNKFGVINGDSVYATGTGYTASANAGTTELGVKDVELKGDDAGNYILNSTSYTEDFTIQRNQLQGDIANATYQYTGSSITVPADDIYLIDQQGNVVTDYTVTYYYHNGEGVEKVAAMKDLGMYTIVVNKDPANYKGGASQTVYVSDTAVEDAPSKDFESATVDITNTVELYGESTGIVATASTGTVSEIAYRVGTEWTTTVPTNAGRYLVKVTTSTDDVAYGLYTIVKANPVLTLNAADTTYDSALYEVSNVTATYNGDTFGELDYYYTYAGDVVIGEHGSDSGVNVDFQAPHDAGTYVVTVHVPETDNYTAEEYSTSFTIAHKELVIKANDKQRHLYSAYPDMLATYEGLATDGVAMDTSLRDIQIMPEFNYDNHNNDSESHVGYYTVTPVDALAKNYVVVDYVPGEFSVNENDPQPTLSIVGAPQNGMNDGKTYAYYGDVIQLYAYGNQKDGVINKSSVLTWEVVSGHAVIDQTGLLTITGTGDIVVKLTRGTGRTAISTELTITALKKEVQVIVPDQDLVYNGASQTYTGVMTAVDDAYNAVNADLVTITESNKDRTEVGSQIVTGIVAQDGNLYYQSETYGGLFTINDKEINIEPNEATTIYGSTATGLGYTEVTPVGGVAALTDGFAVSVADVYNNLDVLDGYEILVAGRENINYNVKYVTDQTAKDVQVTEKALTIKTGSYADTIGKTGGSLNPAGDYPVNGAIVDPAALFETDGLRMYGEPNQVMGFVLETLIDGDSVADVNALLDWLVEFDIDDHHLIDEDANITYPTKDTTKDHVVELDGTVRNYDLHIGTEMDFHNYEVTVQEGTQNIYQRPVTLTTRNGITLSAFRDSILDGSNPDQDAILEILLNNLVVGKYNGEGGLATLLNHTIEDLDIRIVSAVYTPSSDPDSTSAGTIKVTIKLGNVNYWTEDLVFDIDVTKVNIKPVYGPLGRTSSYVTMTKDGAPYDVDGKVFYLIYKKADGDDGSWSYADYRNLTPVVNVEMVKNPYITGRYTATYDALPNGDYVMFAIAENYTIV